MIECLIKMQRVPSCPDYGHEYINEHIALTNHFLSLQISQSPFALSRAQPNLFDDRPWSLNRLSLLLSHEFGFWKYLKFVILRARNARQSLKDCGAFSEPA